MGRLPGGHWPLALAGVAVAAVTSVVLTASGACVRAQPVPERTLLPAAAYRDTYGQTITLFEFPNGDRCYLRLDHWSCVRGGGG